MSEGATRLADRLDAINIVTGKLAAWLTLLMVLVTVVIVVLRYVFDAGHIWLQESLTWMHAVVFMAGAAWTLQQDEHVRVDVFYRGMTDKMRAGVNLLGVLLFVLPFCAFLFIESLDYVGRSFDIREISRDTGGLPYPAIPVLKSMLLLMPVALLLQGISLALRSISRLRRG